LGPPHEVQSRRNERLARKRGGVRLPYLYGRSDVCEAPRQVLLEGCFLARRISGLARRRVEANQPTGEVDKPIAL
jgi:hypothetical protein